ncbi:MAG: hypothetical protein K8I82_01605, partial [Anaerolineae bacterium]|nr:hypothetical protein [Anaerolineae bacterium]
MPILKPHPPYDFQKLLALLRCYPYTTLDRVQGSAYRRVFRVGERLTLVEITGEGTVEQPLLRVDFLAGNPETALIEKIQHVLDTESDSRAAFFQMARRDKKLHPIVSELYGLPLLRTEDVFEAVVVAVIEQQIAWKTALRAQRWLLDWANQSIA